MLEKYNQGHYETSLGVYSRFNSYRQCWELYLPYFDKILDYEFSGDLIEDLANAYYEIDGFYNQIT